MKNLEIAKLFEQAADIMALLEANTFKILAFRKILKRTREYDKDDYSVPIGSRYHPERAELWEPNSPVDTTEKWMGAR